ncbi:dihydrolipoyl dehydrogenase [Roseateles sp. DB2]|uniref:dihydrolipoyl dehydrogenase n=1 Tax=Roseateles sp. DB2 TaxID=3453717 RepID=UPI003EF04272
MREHQVDVAIIGSGTAGMSAYRAALAHSSRVLAIEGGPYGTTCARVGCMPSKLLIAAAEAAHAVAEAGRFGVRVDTPARIDGAAVMDRVRSERDRFVGFVTEAVQGWAPEHRLQGWARFTAPQTLEVKGHDGELHRVHAARIVIATGSEPHVEPAWSAALGDRLIRNDELFDWQTLPAAVLVLGTGVIALELAQALHRLGVRVRVLGRSQRVGPLTDPALQDLSRELFGKELPLSLSQVTPRLRREGDEVLLELDGRVERFDFALAAAGRRPRLANLGLEHSGLPVQADGQLPFDRRTGQVGDAPVFIAGDANGERELLHEAADEGRIAGDNAGRWPDVRVRPRRAPLAVVFSDPQMAIAGCSHAELLAAGTPFLTGQVSFADQGRSRVMGVNRGALHVYAEAGSGRLLGAEMLGPRAEHLGHLLAWSVQRGDTVQQMLDSPFYHPVIEEGLRTALRLLQRELRMGPPPVERCLDCGPGA